MPSDVMKRGKERNLHWTKSQDAFHRRNLLTPCQCPGLACSVRQRRARLTKLELNEAWKKASHSARKVGRRVTVFVAKTSEHVVQLDAPAGICCGNFGRAGVFRTSMGQEWVHPSSVIRPLKVIVGGGGNKWMVTLAVSLNSVACLGKSPLRLSKTGNITDVPSARDPLHRRTSGRLHAP
ncbi:hypothetical protein VTK26DRAFT_4 [Humicola hyalothermophila]